MKVRQAAPSNIALIKYMGKTGVSGNLPANPSLSYTLSHLTTTVELEPGALKDQWQPLLEEDFYPLKLSERGQERFLNHFAFLKKELQIKGFFTVRSANNFPSDCGLASSASSFAALTLAAYSLKRPRDEWMAQDCTLMSELSRQGSGSSCRSIFDEWALWKTEAAEPVRDLDFQDLLHLAVMAEDRIKDVSSSSAHQKVTTSYLFEGRVQRARQRCEDLLAALKSGHWAEAYEITWAEFWDMHALFETSRPAFGYMTGGSLQILETVREFWKKEGDGPLATMDAGPNVHLLFRKDQVDLYKLFHNRLSDSFEVLGSLKL